MIVGELSCVNGVNLNESGQKLKSDTENYAGIAVILLLFQTTHVILRITHFLPYLN